MHNNIGILYLVPTPVGNLADMTFRSVETLKSVSTIACEDTRTSRVLLQHYNIETPTVSYHKFNERERTEQLIGKLLSGNDIAIITDAGSPGISDPAQVIVQAAIAECIRVIALPGATSVIPAVGASGLDTERFLFTGFLPDKQKDRDALIDEIKHLQATIVFFEAPHRIDKTLAWLMEKLGDRNAVIAREISKIHEEYVRGTFSELIGSEFTRKGEMVLLVEGFTVEEVTDDSIENKLQELLETGVSMKQAVKDVAKSTATPKNRVYEIGLSLKQ